jgi:hypothetical protein
MNAKELIKVLKEFPEREVLISTKKGVRKILLADTSINVTAYHLTLSGSEIQISTKVTIILYPEK